MKMQAPPPLPVPPPMVDRRQSGKPRRSRSNQSLRRLSMDSDSLLFHIPEDDANF